MEKISASEKTIKDQIIARSNEIAPAQQPPLTENDITIMPQGDGLWSAGICSDGPALNVDAAFAAIPFVRSKFLLAN